MGARARSLAALGAATAGLLLPARAESSDWSREVRLGYDYFSHDYQVIDRDTTNAFSEGSVRFVLAYRPPPTEDRSLEGQAELFLGKDYWQADLNLERGFSRRGAWAWEAEVSGRQYRSSSSLSFSNDHLLGETRLQYRRPLRPSLELRLSDRVYAIAYAEASDYLYDSVLNDARASVRIGQVLSHSLDLELTHRTLVVPDSSGIGYGSDELSAEYFWMSGLSAMVAARGSTEWRRYPAGSPRSDFLRAECELDLDWAITDDTSLETVLGLEAEWYETLDPIYHNSRTLRVQVGPARDLTDRWDLKFLPGVEIYDVSEYEDPTGTATEELLYLQESYREFLLEIVSDYLRLPRFWCDLSAKVGRRDYEFPDDVLDSDYWYLDLGILAELALWKDTYLDVTALFSPEKHRNPEDNTAINVFSVWLGYGF